MRNTTTCIVCMEGPKTHAAIPCGHLCVCEGCAAVLKECPGCRATATWMKVHAL